MKMIIGLVLVAVGLVSGFYAGLWWAFIGGSLDVIRELRAPELDAMNVAISIAKVVLAGLIGWLAASVAMIPGIALLQSEQWRGYKS